MKNTFSIDQVLKLREIEKARVKSGEPGLRDEVQALIVRLQSGGVGPKSDDPREAQAKRLFDKGFGGEFTFSEYLATIPPVPEFPESYDGCFPELVLVDARLPIAKQCELLGVHFPCDDGTFVAFDQRTAKTDLVYWIRAQDGRKNNGKSVRSCRDSFPRDEVGLTACEGLAIFAQNPKGLKGRAMDLPGSVHRVLRDVAAYLHWLNERPELSWDRDVSWDDSGPPDYGSASRGR